MNPLWQNLLIYALVLWCVWRLVRKYMPNSAWQLQAKLSYYFESKKSVWMKRFGQKIRPAVTIPAGCNTHCTTCNSCK